MSAIVNTTSKIKVALLKQFNKNVPLPTARKAVEKQLSLAAGAVISFDRVYFVAIGEQHPIVFPANATKAQIAKLIKARRNGTDGATILNEGNTKGMSLRRWETVASSASTGLGRKVSVAEAQKLYGDKESYIGRGTKIAAPSARS